MGPRGAGGARGDISCEVTGVSRVGLRRGGARRARWCWLAHPRGRGAWTTWRRRGREGPPWGPEAGEPQCTGTREAGGGLDRSLGPEGEGRRTQGRVPRPGTTRHPARRRHWQVLRARLPEGEARAQAPVPGPGASVQKPPLTLRADAGRLLCGPSPVPQQARPLPTHPCSTDSASLAARCLLGPCAPLPHLPHLAVVRRHLLQLRGHAGQAPESLSPPGGPQRRQGRPVCPPTLFTAPSTDRCSFAVPFLEASSLPASSAACTGLPLPPHLFPTPSRRQSSPKRMTLVTDYVLSTTDACCGPDPSPDLDTQMGPAP